MFGSEQWAYNASSGFYPETIDGSLRFNDNDNAYLSRTPSTAGNRKTWTWSGWVKRGNLGSSQTIFAAGATTSPLTYLRFNSDNTIAFVDFGVVTTFITSAVFRDVSSWYHIVLKVDTTQATSTDRVVLYINGIQQPFSSTSYPAQNQDTDVNNTVVHKIGDSATLSQYLDGYLAEVHFTDGTAYDATAFGEFKNGVWVPKEVSVTYGTNGFYLDFADGGALGNDVSGNNNDWTPTNLASTDVMLDSPTNNFATLNSVDNSETANIAWSEGNLEVASGVSGAWRHVRSTMAMSSGKWYCEILPVSGVAAYDLAVGLTDTSLYIGGNNYCGKASTSYGYLADTGTKRNNSVGTAYGATYTDGDIIGIAFDADSGDLTFYKNGVSQGTAYTVTSGIDYAFALAGVNGTVVTVANFGQDSSFAGNKVAQGNTDANGRGDFYYAPPTGYLALCTANLPEPAISPLDDASPSDHFNVITYTGDGLNTRQITGVGFQPDFTWIKRRNTTGYHATFNSVMGATKWLYPNATDAEDSATYNNDAAFLSDGFKPDNAGSTNASGSTYVAWNWKADNTSGSSNTNGSITSTVSANVDAGFSIVSYTGNNTAGATIGHGLSQKPELYITKGRDNGDHWAIGLGHASNYLYLNLTNAQSSNTGFWNNTAPTSSVITLGSDSINNGNGLKYITYCFHSVDGYSKIGSYTGNGSTDGPFVYTGFRPAFVICKRTDSGGHWVMYDSSRGDYNTIDNQLLANDSAAEQDLPADIDFLSNGFKLRDFTNRFNTSGASVIYMAFAENPFKYANAR